MSQQVFAAPVVYDLVICRFPYTNPQGEACSEPRPAVVLNVEASTDDRPYPLVMVMECSSRVWNRRPDDFMVLRKDDPIGFTQTGLRSDSFFKMDQVVSLPFTEQHFKIPKYPEYGQNPKIGHFTKKMIEDFKHALRAWIASPLNPRNAGHVARPKYDPKSVR